MGQHHRGHQGRRVKNPAATAMTEGELTRRIPQSLVTDSGEEYRRIDNKLGTGGFSVCYLMERGSDKTLVAAKFFNRKQSR
jgi:hypothetical protein